MDELDKSIIVSHPVVNFILLYGEKSKFRIVSKHGYQSSCKILI